MGDYGPVISVALYSQHMNALVKKEVKLRSESRDVRAVRNNGMLLVTSWSMGKQQKVEAKVCTWKADWKQDLKQTGHSVPVEGLLTSAISAASAAATAVCMTAVAAATAGRTVKQKRDWSTVMTVLVTIAMAVMVVAAVSAAAIWRCSSIWQAAGTGAVSATGMSTIVAEGWKTTIGAEALEFIGHIGDKPVVTGMDTDCETLAIRRSLVDPKWEVLDAENMQIKGVGCGLLGPRVRVPYRHRFNMENSTLGARIVDD